jgi:hypothetical protein
MLFDELKYFFPKIPVSEKFKNRSLSLPKAKKLKGWSRLPQLPTETVRKD